MLTHLACVWVHIVIFVNVAVSQHWVRLIFMRFSGKFERLLLTANTVQTFKFTFSYSSFQQHLIWTSCMGGSQRFAHGARINTSLPDGVHDWFQMRWCGVIFWLWFTTVKASAHTIISCHSTPSYSAALPTQNEISWCFKSSSSDKCAVFNSTHHTSSQPQGYLLLNKDRYRTRDPFRY